MLEHQFAIDWTQHKHTRKFIDFCNEAVSEFFTSTTAIQAATEDQEAQKGITQYSVAKKLKLHSEMASSATHVEWA